MHRPLKPAAKAHRGTGDAAVPVRSAVVVPGTAVVPGTVVDPGTVVPRMVVVAPGTAVAASSLRTSSQVEERVLWSCWCSCCGSTRQGSGASGAQVYQGTTNLACTSLVPASREATAAGT